MKVALVVADLNIRGGTHKTFIRLASFLKDHGCEVSIHTFEFDPSRCYPEIAEFQVHEARYQPGTSLLRNAWQSIVSTLKLVASIPPDVDVINVHDMACYGTMSLARILRARALLVWQINDLPHRFHVGPAKDLPRSWTDPFVRGVIRMIARQCDAITVNVRKNQVLVSELLGMESRLYYPGVDQVCDLFISRQVSRPIRLVSIGVFYPYRNYEVILSAMESLRKRGVTTQLTIIGATDRAPAYAESISNLAKSKELEVEITGEVDEARFKQIMTDSQIFLFTNLDQSWGLAVFEAMNLSLPVILSDSVGAVELLEGCKGVSIIDARSTEQVANAIMEIGTSPTKYCEMAAAGFERSRALGYDKLYCPDMLNLFSELKSESR